MMGVLFLPPLAAAEDIGSHIVSRIEQKALGVQSYKANFDLWLRAGGKEFFLTGVTLFKWPKMLRTEMSLRDSKELSQVIYWKGGIVWQYLPSARVAFRQQEEILRGKYPDAFASQDLINLQNPFDLIETKTLKFIDEERVDGKTMYLFEGVPKKAIRHQGVLTPALCRMRVADENGLLQDLILYDASGQEILKQHFWDIQPNLELLEEEFEFRPENVKLVEITQETEKKMRLMLKEDPSP